MTKLFSISCFLFLIVFAHCIPTEQNKGRKKLSDEPHTNEDGEHHNAKYDHEAFLGKEEAAEFDSLPMEESMRRLRIICDKIDKDSDQYLSHDELREWVVHVSRRRFTDSVKTYFPHHDRNNDSKISWDEYRTSTYGVVKDADQIYDERRGLTFKNAIDRDEKRFKISDQNKDNHLDEEEFMAFIHPEEFDHTKSIHIDESFEDMDKSKDGSISLEEYLEDIWPSLDRGDSEEEPQWVKDERRHFNTQRDTDGDSKLSKRELAAWIYPEGYDPAHAEASHLIHHADSDKDKKLSIDEVMNNHALFVGSHATEFGGYLKRHDEF